MKRIWLAAAVLLALPGLSPAQRTMQTAVPERVKGAVKHAGIYHLSTGTWTRTGRATANFGPDTIYSNTKMSGYFTSAGGAGGFAPGSTNFDEGVVATFDNPNVNADRDIYTVNCVTIGYCDFGAPGSSGWELRFYNEYTPCTYDPFFNGSLQVGGLPASGCWTLDFDLSGGQEFCLAGDGGDGFQDDVDVDSFGWSFRYTGADGSVPAGFMLSGDAQATEPNYVTGSLPTDGTNTYFGVPSLCGPDRATGFFTQDFWYLEDPSGASSGCYFFGPVPQTTSCVGPINPYASFFLELQAETGVCDQFSICVPNGCTSNPNSLGVNSSISASGSTSIAQNNVTLKASVSPNSVGYFITSQTSGFVPNPGGSAGNVCLGAGIGRFQQAAMTSGVLGVISLSTLTGQWDLASIPAAGGAYAALPGTDTHFQCWHRDSATAGPTSNFTDGCSILWTP